MESKTLQIIQKIAKVGNILSKVVFILCIVGAVGSLVGVVSLALVPWDMEYEGQTIKEYCELNSGMTIESLATYCFIGVISCIVEAFIAKKGELYFKHELEAGTPFTFEGAKEFFDLAVMSIIVSFATSVLVAIGVSVASAVNSNIKDVDFDLGFDIGLGLVMMAGSLLMKLGAEQNAKKENAVEAEELE